MSSITCFFYTVSCCYYTCVYTAYVFYGGDDVKEYATPVPWDVPCILLEYVLSFLHV